MPAGFEVNEQKFLTKLHCEILGSRLQASPSAVSGRPVPVNPELGFGDLRVVVGYA